MAKYIDKQYLIDNLKNLKSVVLDETYITIAYTTQADYEALTTKDTKTLYVFDDSEGETQMRLGEKELAGEGYDIWIGTKAEWEAQSKTSIKDKTIVIITDDFDGTKIVTTWSSTTSDGNVPSEKLVKDSLDETVKGNTLGYYMFSGFKEFVATANTHTDYEEDLSNYFPENAKIVYCVGSINGTFIPYKEITGPSIWGSDSQKITIRVYSNHSSDLTVKVGYIVFYTLE